MRIGLDTMETVAWYCPVFWGYRVSSKGLATLIIVFWGTGEAT